MTEADYRARLGKLKGEIRGVKAQRDGLIAAHASERAKLQALEAERARLNEAHAVVTRLLNVSEAELYQVRDLLRRAVGVSVIGPELRAEIERAIGEGEDDRQREYERVGSKSIRLWGDM